ncbi:hypothetical protein P9112_000494 [Eukaryota sp. TZLM1-RC]
MKLFIFAVLLVAALASEADDNIVVNIDGENKVLTPKQVLSYAKKAGFTGQLAHTMVCIAKYESSYNSKAVNKNRDGSIDRGLWQINSRWWCADGHNGCKVACSALFNPDTAARCARTVYKQQGLKAWVAYTKHKSTCDKFRVK